MANQAFNPTNFRYAPVGQLEEESRKLKQLMADLSLGKAMLDVLTKEA